MAKIIFTATRSTAEKLSPWAIIPKDSKCFGPADLDQSITHFVTSDKRSNKTLGMLKKETDPKFDIIDISPRHTEFFGVLDL